MVKQIKNISIREYKPKDRELIESFRRQTFKEGNNSLRRDKYNPDTVDGKTWMTFVGDDLAAISVCEAGHYTGDPLISARICRYHILKKHRHCNAGFRMLAHQVKWAKQKGFKVIYWTSDITHRSLNALYQNQKIQPGKESFFKSDLYRSFKLQKDFLFKVSPKSDLLQYIYSKTLQDGYNWVPKANVIFIDSAAKARGVSRREKSPQPTGSFREIPAFAGMTDSADRVAVRE